MYQHLKKYLLTILFLSFSWQSGALAINNNQIPFEIGPRGHILLSIEVNGIKKQFIFDTGAGRSALNKERIDDLKLNQASFQKIKINRIHSEEDSFMVDVDSFKFGNLEKFDNKAVLMDLSGMEAGQIVVDGIVGFDLFGQFDISINYGEKIISFDQQAVASQCGALNGEEFSLMHGTHIKFNSEIGDKLLPTILDTGASLSTMNLPAAEMLLPGATEQFAKVKAAHGAHPASHADSQTKSGEHVKTSRGTNHANDRHMKFQEGMLSLNNIQVAQQTLAEQYTISVSSVPIFAMFGMQNTPGMLMGSDLLKNQKVTISYGCKKLMFIPAASM
jgi:predicted aspartyl protease